MEKIKAGDVLLCIAKDKLKFDYSNYSYDLQVGQLYVAKSDESVYAQQMREQSVMVYGNEFYHPVANFENLGPL